LAAIFASVQFARRCYTVWVFIDKENIMDARWKVAIAAGYAAALLAASAASAQAQVPNPNAARALAATCFTCHGTDGRSVGGVPPSLAGQGKASLLQQLRDFKDGKRPGTIMPQHAKGYTDAQLEQIAGYFASIKP
jgi:cytochrome c553